MLQTPFWHPQWIICIGMASAAAAYRSHGHESRMKLSCYLIESLVVTCGSGKTFAAPPPNLPLRQKRPILALLHSA